MRSSATQTPIFSRAGGAAGIRLHLSAALLAGLLPLGRSMAQTATATAASIDATAPVEAVLLAAGKTAKVNLVGRSDGKVAYKELNTSNSKTKLLSVEMLEETHFKIDLKRNELDKIVSERQWMKAASKLLTAVKPTLPYIDLPNNNVAELVLNTGDYIMRAAALEIAAATTEEQTAAAKKKYEAAYSILRHSAKATWSSHGTISRVKGIKCLLEMGKPKTAAHYFTQIEEPFPGDAAYGIYWLIKAEIEIKQEDWREAMDAAIKSLAFENKDIDTFPDALLLSARCYEEMQEWYRARDVYYEVARLFPKTDWSDAAVRRLEFIMEKKLTADKEVRPIENVFFAFNDDINALTEELLEALKLGTDVDAYSHFDEEEDEFGEKDLDAPEKDEKGFLD